MLARAGARVLLTDSDAEAVRHAAAELQSAGLAGEGQTLEVSDEAAVRAVFAALAERHGRLDVLVNSAGVAKRSPAVDTELSDWNR